MEEAKQFAAFEDPDRTEHALNAVFRKLLANLLLDYENPKFRKVRRDNEAVARHTAGLSPSLVAFLFTALGFGGDPDEDSFVHFSGSRETLKSADAIYSALEDAISVSKGRDATFLRGSMADRTKHPPNTVSSPSPQPQPLDRKSLLKDEAQRTFFNPEDFMVAEPLLPVARKTLLNTGRIRNCFFDARGFTLRRMTHGRVCACSEKCGNECLEAHWHHYTGKGLMYAYVAHLSQDGATLLHKGAEYGYQYNSIPGTENFGKTVLFTEKFLTVDGQLLYNKHPNKVVTTCVYCNEPFAKLFL